MQYRTDLALEHCEAAALPADVRVFSRKQNNITIETVEIQTDDYIKPRGRYVTVTVPMLSAPHAADEAEIEAIACEVAAMLPKTGTVLIAGLGNKNITPDALGPRCAGQIIATRHLAEETEAVLGKLRPAAAIAPGVLGQTGMESDEIIKALVKQIAPDAVVVVDALATKSAARLGCTIQISDSGISPGSGVMNARQEISQKTLGIPVIAVGVPTVVDAATLVAELTGSEHNEESSKIGGMMVTPRDIDQLITHASHMLALVINRAVQKTLPLEIIAYLMG